MKTLVVFYSYTGKVRAIAQQIASEGSFELVEIVDVKPVGTVKAYTKGCFFAVHGRAWPIAPLGIDLEAYDRFILISPIWTGHVPPAVNALLEILPEERVVAVKLVSTTGKSSCKERLEEVVRAKGGTLESIEDIQV